MLIFTLTKVPKPRKVAPPAENKLVVHDPPCENCAKLKTPHVCEALPRQRCEKCKKSKQSCSLVSRMFVMLFVPVWGLTSLCSSSWCWPF